MRGGLFSRLVSQEIQELISALRLHYYIAREILRPKENRSGNRLRKEGAADISFVR
jgi:hypothetical protein